MNIQLYISKKNFDVQKAERYFKERRIKVQVMDLKKHKLGERELQVFARAGGVQNLIDRDDKKVRETIDFLLNREEAHNQMFRDAFNQVQNSGSNQDFGTTKAAKMYFSLSNPGPNTFANNNVTPPKYSN